MERAAIHDRGFYLRANNFFTALAVISLSDCDGPRIWLSSRYSLPPNPLEIMPYL